jgi:peptide/nickel transport system permease protein
MMAAIPSFFLGYLLIYWLAFKPLRDLGIELFPLPGAAWDPWDLRALVLPALTLAIVTAPFYIRLTRNVMADELHRDHIRTARAKGLPERTIAWRHAFRNALPPITAQAGLDLGFLLGGIVVVESVFSWPGIGQQAVESITSEDLPVLMGTLLLGTFFIVAANIVVDVIIALLDPRVGLWGDSRA